MQRLVVAASLLCGCFGMPPRPGGNGPGGGPGDDGNGGDDGTTSGEPANIVFVTSTTHDAAIGGLTGADAICNQLAADARPNSLPGNYVAWLSSGAVSAKERLGSAHGWVRTDGAPVVDTIDDLLAGKLIYPILLDENGTAHYSTGLFEYVRTGTTPAGSVGPGDLCGEYEVSDVTDVAAGAADGTMGQWTTTSGPLQSGTILCKNAARLYCFGIDHQATVTKPALPPTTKHAFVSTATWLANKGIANADALCMTEATNAMLPGNYRALLNTTTAAAPARFTAGDVYVRVDGVTVGTLGATIGAPINLSATGESLSVPVWSGGFSITDTGTDCSNWASATSGTSGSTGQSDRAATVWFAERLVACNQTSNHLYCLQR